MKIMKSLLFGILFSITLVPVWAVEEDVIFHENFESTDVGSLPSSCKFEGAGTAQAVELPGSGKVLMFSQTKAADKATTLSFSLPSAKDVFTVSLKIRPEAFTGMFNMILEDSRKSQVVSASYYNGYLYHSRVKPVAGSAYLGECPALDLKTSTMTAWTELTLVISLPAQSFDAYANGVQTGTGITFFTDAKISDIGRMTFAIRAQSTGIVYLDKILVLAGAHPPAGARRLSDPLPQDVKFAGGKSVFRGYERYRMTVGNGVVSVLCPKNVTLPGKPWLWRGSFWGEVPRPVTELTVLADLKLLDQGFHVVCAGGAGVFPGHPSGNAQMDAIYNAMTGLGLSRKPALTGISRETLSVYQWAAANPDKVGCIYIDNGVCDTRSWPAGQRVAGNPSKAIGDATQWQAFLKAYGYKSDPEGLAHHGNPIDLLEPLARAKVPLLHVCGDKDTCTPYEENSGIVKSRYEAMGGPIEIILKKGVGHELCGLEDPTPILDFIRRNTKPEMP
jgi:pimeloyl-ACP methyl ester carboxylesterase